MIALLVGSALAHQLQPALLELRGRAGGQVAVSWTRPLVAGGPSPLSFSLPGHCVIDELKTAETTQGVRQWGSAACGPAGLTQGEISVTGLAQTGGDALVVWQAASGPERTAVLHAGGALLELADAVRRPALALGAAHILGAADHLLFIVGLIGVSAARPRRLLWTLTMFTVGHSLTLGAAVFGAVRPPEASVEAMIALSVVLLAAEVLRGERRQLAGNHPQVFALACGLLHGLGFAGALTGLSDAARLRTLLLFNCGVELGQIAVVGVVAGALVVARRLARERWPHVRRILRETAGTLIGGIGCYWLLKRTVQIFS